MSDTVPCDGDSIIPEERKLRPGSKLMIQLPPAPAREILRCLADIQKIEIRDGLPAIPPTIRFNLTQERMIQDPRLN